MTVFFLSLGSFPTHAFHGEYKLEKIFLEPLTQITGVPEGDAAGEIFINQGMIFIYNTDIYNMLIYFIKAPR